MDRENSEVEMEMQRKERLNEKESREARKTARRKSVEVWATDCERAVEPINRADFMSGFDDGWLSRGKADRPLWEKHKEQERQALIAALAERDRLDPDAPKTVIVGGEIETFEITQEEIDAVPSGDPGQWEISMRELCQEIEKLPASEQQTAISVKASAIYQSLGEFNRYCESFFDAVVSEKLCNFMNTHAFQPGDSEHGWEKQCSVIAPDGLRHCGGYREDHPMSVKAEGK